MSIFSSKQSYLGIDIGALGIKMVELGPEKNKARLLTYGYADFMKEGSLLNAEFYKNAQAALTKLLKDTRATSKMVISAIPNHSVFSSILRLPTMNTKDLASAIHWEAKKFVPLPVEEMVLDWKALDDQQKKGFGKGGGETGQRWLSKKDTKKENEKNKGEASASHEEKKDPKSDGDATMRILITAAPKNIVQKYSDFFSEAGLELVGLETESFALERSLVGLDRTPTMVVDIGASSTSIIITENGIPILSRNIDVGGQNITQSIMHRLRIDYRRAEQFKRDIGFSESVQNSIPKSVESTVSPILNEIKYAFDVHLAHQQSSRVERIILTGGSAYLPKLPEYISEMLDIRVFIGNPWSRVMYPEELKPALEEIGPRFAGAIGLAMRELFG